MGSCTAWQACSEFVEDFWFSSICSCSVELPYCDLNPSQDTQGDTDADMTLIFPVSTTERSKFPTMLSGVCSGRIARRIINKWIEVSEQYLRNQLYRICWFSCGVGIQTERCLLHWNAFFSVCPEGSKWQPWKGTGWRQSVMNGFQHLRSRGKVAITESILASYRYTEVLELPLERSRSCRL